VWTERKEEERAVDGHGIKEQNGLTDKKNIKRRRNGKKGGSWRKGLPFGQLAETQERESSKKLREEERVSCLRQRKNGKTGREREGDTCETRGESSQRGRLTEQGADRIRK